MPSVREFKAHLSRYLAEVRAGRVLEITRHRRPVARVVGVPDEAGAGLAAMIAAGEADWSGGKPLGCQVRLCEGGATMADVVLQDRG
ncbi:MAG: type II toxin-antitoxin system prevent-host-death family antitoxin [Wenzhouxiangella sp.]|nr:MAG: type II toxin-antitoxin system prevent-host-death family antitoxin [Wenzhouxiangella sp.]